jgi:hypothetical protein
MKLLMSTIASSLLGSNILLNTHERMLHMDYYRKSSVEKKKNTGRGPQGARHHDELIGGKPPVVKYPDPDPDPDLFSNTIRMCSSLNIGN